VYQVGVDSLRYHDARSTKHQVWNDEVKQNEELKLKGKNKYLHMFGGQNTAEVINLETRSEPKDKNKIEQVYVF
jgi:hypothetical protein